MNNHVKQAEQCGMDVLVDSSCDIHAIVNSLDVIASSFITSDIEIAKNLCQNDKKNITENTPGQIWGFRRVAMALIWRANAIFTAYYSVRLCL